MENYISLHAYLGVWIIIYIVPSYDIAGSMISWYAKSEPWRVAYRQFILTYYKKMYWRKRQIRPQNVVSTKNF
jgi:hypothetical protein